MVAVFTILMVEWALFGIVLWLIFPLPWIGLVWVSPCCCWFPPALCTQGFPAINMLLLAMVMLGGGALVRGPSSPSALGVRFCFLTHSSGFSPNSVFLSWLRNLRKVDVHVSVFLAFWQVIIRFLNQNLAYTITQKVTKQKWCRRTEA